ncbi:TRAP transporter small permease [Cytobacillus firmus]|uniref:TRAP transporter small permease n=1 Tax=Cytobacillus firmus TaxID=1399 RepID=UPI00249466D4|nr:TRAP transporter small permease subunit [Cytobacillus firmus]
MSLVNKTKFIAAKLISFQHIISVVILFSLLTLIFIQVLLRYVFNLPLMGIEELMLFPTIWLYMLGAANASEERSHIVVDIADVFIKNQKVLQVIHLIKYLVCVVIGVILTFWFFTFFQYSLQLWKYSPLLSLPMFFAESALFIGVLLMALYSISDFIKNMKSLLSKNDSKQREGIQ